MWSLQEAKNKFSAVVDAALEGTPQEGAARAFAERVKHISHSRRGDTEMEKEGIFTGSFCLNPFTGEKIPIYLAASQPAMLRLAGEVCDGVVLMGAADPEFCSWQLDFIHEGLAAAGRDRREVTIDLFVTMSVGDDEATAIADIRAWATSQAATFHPWKRMPPAWERFRPEFARAADAYHLVDHLSLQARHRRIVSDDFARSVALAGDLDTCVDRLRRLWQLDIDRITFALLSGGRQQRLAHLSGTVIPAVEAAGRN